MMTDDRWLQVKEIFHSALARAPDQRAAFLRDACGKDIALRNEAESLLAAHAAAGSFAESAAIGALVPHDSLMVNRTVPAMIAGFEFGPYRILAPLDAGGMGEVYRALDTRLHREVAIKVLPTTLCADPERIARLEREARLLAVLNHPHIATIHGLEIAGGVHAIVMALIDGPTLADRLSSGPLALDVAMEAAHQIAEALEAAHEKGIIHCDLKPANIKFTATGTVIVLDFGLATALAAQPYDVRGEPVVGDAASSGGGVMGTPAYMSPEQARGQRVDARSDVWAFGCVVYEMLTAHSAFGRATLADTLTSILKHEPDWERLPPDVPVAIRRMLRRCLERDPRRRLHHVADARLEIEDAAIDSEGAARGLVTAFSRRRVRMLSISTAVLAIALAAALGASFLRPLAHVPEFRVVDIATPRTSDPWSFALSPDGRRIAFVADHDGQSMLWVRALDAAAAQTLPGTEGARRPFWSPDSRSIGFFVNSELRRIEARGGSARSVAYALGGTTAAWGPDGTILFSGADAPSLRRVDAAGGSVKAATIAAVESTGHRHPQFLPGGRQFLFFAGGPDSVRGVYLGSLQSSEVTRLTASDTQGAYVAPGWLLFVRQGTLLAQHFDLDRRILSGEPVIVADSVAFEPITGAGAFSTSDVGVMAYRAGRPSVTRLSWFDRSGKALGTLGSAEQAGLSNLRLSPNGRRVVAERTLQSETDLWLLDATYQTRFTRGSDGRIARLPIWSPDGERIAFESVASGAVKLAVKPASGAGDEAVLFESPQGKIPCDWSPDGRFLLYYIPDPNTGTDLWVLPEATRVPFIFLKTPANELWGQFSPDGRWVAYQSNETGRYEIYVRAFPASGGAFPVSTAGGVYPRWSRDGKELYFIAPDAKMMAVPIRAMPTMIEAGMPAVLFQTQRVGGGMNVIGRGPQYDVTSDGRFLVNVDVESGALPITLLMNWKP
jgi:Tol biopolymer transport system component